MDQSTVRRLFLCGDVMTGRGIDQALLHPGNATLYETYVRDARDYITLAEAAHGQIRRPLEFSAIWGETLALLDQSNVDLRLVNLETSITRNDERWRGKGIHYRMHPQNIGCLKAAKIDCCSLANNHTLDWNRAGLLETIETFEKNQLTYGGAGRTVAEAERPAVITTRGKRFIVFALGSTDSGIPLAWQATSDCCGLNVINDFSQETSDRICRMLNTTKSSGDVAVASIHWGSNWGYDIPDEHINFAHRLIDGGFDIIHGHSSHHALPFEVYHDRLILYGCGDFINDYEGITGYESFRGDLAPMYLVDVDESGSLCGMQIVLFRMKCFQLIRANNDDLQWMKQRLEDMGAMFNVKLEVARDKSLRAELDNY